MAIINVNDYLSIMTDYNTAVTSLSGVSDNYFNSAYTVLISNIFDPEIDLLVSFHTAYNVSVSAYASAPTAAINAIRALQDHIISKGVSIGVGGTQSVGDAYDDINDYYSDYPGRFTATIPSGFATMSTQSGHAIDSAWLLP